MSDEFSPVPDPSQPARTLALGLGCERGADPDDVFALARAVLDEAGLTHRSLAVVVSLDRKADERAIHAVAERFGVPARFFDAARLEAEAHRLNAPSAIVFARTGCHGVAEAAALAALGNCGELIVAKRVSGRATAALGRAARPLNVSRIGRARGHGAGAPALPR